MAFTLPDLPYGYDALEPYIDTLTMQIHHDKHHNTYVTKLNAAIEGLDVPDDVHKLIGDLSKIPEDKRTAVRNNGGGHANHSLFWTIMAPPDNGGGGEPDGELREAIDKTFGGFDQFKEQFKNTALGRFGSGWAWLGVGKDGNLCLCDTLNQDNPLMGPDYVSCPCTPIMGIDVWEHAYYLKYQNRRPDYVDAWFNVVNWSQVAENFKKAKGG